MTDSGAERAARWIDARKFAEGLYALLSLGDAAKLPNSFVAVVTEQAEAWKSAIIREETGTQWLVLYAKLRERECCCNVCPEQGYNDICEWCAEHPEGDWDHVEAALTEADLSPDDPFAPLPAAPDEGGKR